MKIKNNVWCVMLLIANASLEAVRPIICFDGKDIKRKPMQLIANEQECIKVAMYMFTDKDIAKKLIEARKRGVRVEAIVDNSTINSSHGMAEKLRKFDIPVMQRENVCFSSCMHLKCWLFGLTKLNNNHYSYKPCILTGSCNCTYNGVYRNDEMMVLLFGKDVFNKCNKNFKELKKHSKYIPKKP